MTKQMCGKANHRKVWRMAEEMAEQARTTPALNLPDWAGLAWIISPYYNHSARNVESCMGETWMTRARMLCRGLAK